MGMLFSEGRLGGSREDMFLLSEMFSTLNAFVRRAVSLSVRAKIPADNVTVDWAKKAGVFRPYGYLEDVRLTSDQERAVAGLASDLRKTDAAISKYVAASHAKQAEETRKKSADKSGWILSLRKPPSPFAKPKAIRMRADQLERAIEARAGLAARASRLEASSKRHAKWAESGLGPRCFGGKHLAKQRHLLGAEGSAFDSEEAWLGAWIEKRDLSWFFEGSKYARGANPCVKWDAILGRLKIQLLPDQTERRLMELADEAGMGFEEASTGQSPKHASLRAQASRFELDLSFEPKKGNASAKKKRQALIEAQSPLGFEALDAMFKRDREERLAARAKKTLIQNEWQAKHPGKAMSEAMAYMPKEPADLKASSEKFAARTRPCAEPVGWRISMRLAPLKKSGKAKKGPPRGLIATARAEWRGRGAELATHREGGALGIDINNKGISLARCDAHGNRPSKHAKTGFFFREIAYAEAGYGKAGFEGRSSEQIEHRIHEIAKEVVALALELGIPLCMENLDFEDKKKSLRYKHALYARMLSSFAYRKLIDAILARAEKCGAEIIFVDPAWTSVAGFSKFSRLGLNPDTAAAFAIARKGLLSKKGDLRTRDAQGGKIKAACRLEKLEGKDDPAGRLLARIGEAEAAKKSKADARAARAASPIEIKAGLDPAQAGLSACPGAASACPGQTGKLPVEGDAKAGQRSMPRTLNPNERKLSKALGKDRREWAKRLAGPMTQRGMETLPSQPRPIRTSQETLSLGAKSTDSGRAWKGPSPLGIRGGSPPQRAVERRKFFNRLL